MPLNATLAFKLPDGTVHEMTQWFPWNDESIPEWWWTDGIGGCDWYRSFVLREQGANIPQFPPGKTIELASCKIESVIDTDRGGLIEGA